MRKKWIFYFIGALLGSPCYAQSITPSTLNSAGNSAVVGTNTHEWSVGEMVLVNTATAGSHTVTQGLLQPTYLSNADINEETLGAQDPFILFPNPSDGQIFLQPHLGVGTVLDLTLVDLSGKVLLRNQAVLYNGNEAQSVDLNSYAAGMYILSVQWQHDNKPKHVTYKVEKR